MARAFRWQELLDTGEAGSIDELARKYDVDRSYVGRILKLTSLAPDIVEAILAGDEPSGLSLGTLRGGVPVRWDEGHSCYFAVFRLLISPEARP